MLQANNYAKAKEIARWKETVVERWDSIHVVSKNESVLDNGAETGNIYKLQYVIDEQGLNDAVGLELVILNNNNKSDRQVYAVNEFKMTKQEGNNYTFEVELEPDEAGAYRIAVRMFPKNKDLPHRQDICYVKWLD